MNGPPELLIVGACTRAAAASAVRAGLSPHCVDHFADRDLAGLGTAERVEPEAGASGLKATALRLGRSRWIYTGPLENHPDVVANISSYHALLGNSAEVLRGIRDPFHVAEILGRRGLPSAEVAAEARGLPTDGSWLIKPRASGGGLGIRRLHDSSQFDASTSYAQRLVAGTSFAALYLADRGLAELLGVSRQLIGLPALPYVYCGSMGPCVLPLRAMETLRITGEALAEAFGLIGLFGVDFILHGHEPVLIEVNPRYTASVEIIELATGRSLLAEHVRACGGDAAAPPARRPAAPVVGKLVLYATEAGIAPEIPVPRPVLGDRLAMPEIADIPWPGTPIGAGEPILTVFAHGENSGDCERHLRKAAERWQVRLL